MERTPLLKEKIKVVKNIEVREIVSLKSAYDSDL
jgi:hypothetical protein